MAPTKQIAGYYQGKPIYAGSDAYVSQQYQAIANPQKAPTSTPSAPTQKAQSSGLSTPTTTSVSSGNSERADLRINPLKNGTWQEAADRYGVSVEALKAANPNQISSNNPAIVGNSDAILNIPRGASTAPTTSSAQATQTPTQQNISNLTKRTNELLGSTVFDPVTGQKIAAGSTAGQEMTPDEKIAQAHADALSKERSDVETRSSALLKSSMEKVSESKPEAPNLVSTYDTLKTKYGVSAAQDEYNAAKEELRALQDTISSDKYKAKGAPVSSVYAGRKLAYIDQETADALNRAQTKVQNAADHLDTQNKIVSEYMSLTDKDYTNALNAYNSNFSQSLQLYNIVDSAQTDEYNRTKAQLDSLISMKKDNPAAFINITDTTKATLNSLETKLGYPQGTMEAYLTAYPSLEYKFSRSDGNGNVTIFGEDPVTKQIKVMSTYSEGTGGQGSGKVVKSGSFTTTEGEIARIARENLQRGQDGYAGTDKYLKLRDNWLAAGGLESDFFQQYPPKTYLNPNDTSVPAYIRRMMGATDSGA